MKSCRFNLLRALTCVALSLPLVFPTLIPGPAFSDGPNHCRDRAVPVGSTPYVEGEPVVLRRPDDRSTLVASWISGAPIRVGPDPVGHRPSSPIWGSKIVLAQRGADGQWREEDLTYGIGDPWLDSAPSGNVYLAYGGGRSELADYVHRVNRHGKSTMLAELPFGDGPAIAVDQSSRNVDRLLLASITTGPPYNERPTLQVSNDGGLNWSKPVAAWTHRNFVYARHTAIASGARTVVAAWIEHTIDSKSYLSVASIDQEGKFRRPTYFKLPRSDGYSFGYEESPSISVVRGGAHAGRAYLTWAQTENRLSNVYYSYSDDGGGSWSMPRIVNLDAIGSLNVYPSVSAKSDGGAVIVWMGNRETLKDPSQPSWQQGTVMYYAYVSGSRLGDSHLLTSCPSFWETEDQQLGDYFNFDASNGNPVILFPNIRQKDGDSDVYLIELDANED